MFSVFFFIFIINIILSVFARISPTTPHDTKPFTNELSLSDSVLPAIQLIPNSGLYYINTYFGSSSTKMLLLIDSQRSYTSIMSNNCKICKDVNLFNPLMSDTFKRVKYNFTIYMYNEEFIGDLCTDGVRIPDNINMKDFDFALISNITHNEQYSLEGFLGFGFTKNPNEGFAKQLKTRGIINSAVLGLLLRVGVENSLLHLGGYDKNIINETNKEKIIYSNITYVDDDNRTNWYIPMKSVQIKQNLINLPQKIILNSASNVIRIPKVFFFENMDKMFSKTSECQMWKDNVFHCKCDSTYSTVFPTFIFTFDNGKQNDTLKITPNDYVSIDNSGAISTDSTSSCLLMLALNYKNDYWILGTNLMNDFYLIFDYENSRIGFYDLANYAGGAYGSVLILSLIIVSASVLFFSVLYCIYKRFAQRRDDYNEVPEVRNQ